MKRYPTHILPVGNACMFSFLPSWGSSGGPVSPEAPPASWPAWHSDLGEKERGKQ